MFCADVAGSRCRADENDPSRTWSYIPDPALSPGDHRPGCRDSVSFRAGAYLFGTWYWRSAERVFIRKWPGYDQRQDMLREAINLVRELWKGGEVTFEGKYYQTHKARLYTPPVDNSPSYISSKSPNSAKFSGKHRDGIITVGSNKPEIYQEALKNFEIGAEESGRDPAKMPRLIELSVIYGEDLQSGTTR